VNVHLLCVGGVKGPLRETVQDYEKRLARYWRYEAVEVRAGAGKASQPPPSLVREMEEERLLSRLAQGPGEVVALTRVGKPLGSRELARRMARWAVNSAPTVTFVIGGAFGLGEGVLKRSTLQLSLSALTLPHEIARLVMVEQLYRAGTILQNEPYHKGP
jgi:23S rRNA (pseudouridine1915-N3)-methyltransferase